MYDSTIAGIGFLWPQDGNMCSLFSGAAIGGAAGTYLTWDKFKPVSTVLKNLNKGQKQILYNKAMAILNNLSYSDLATLTSLAMGDAAVKQRIIGTVIDHVSNELKMKIIDWVLVFAHNVPLMKPTSIFGPYSELGFFLSRVIIAKLLCF